MPLVVEQVLGLADLGLVLRTPDLPLDRQVRWVAVSELADPAPWLDGGELLLTTGLTMTDDPADADDYVAALVEADVAALGFGVGMSHEQIPTALLQAAMSRGLPVLEIPQPVPFVAIGKAVLHLLTEEEYADSTASFNAQRQLIRAVLADDADPAVSIAAVLARHVDGFSVVLDGHGDVLASFPGSASKRVSDYVDEIDRLRPRGVLGSAAVVTADEHAAILPIGARGSADGFLLVGSSRTLTSGDKAVMNLAVSVLTWHGVSSNGVIGEANAWHSAALTSMRHEGVTSATLQSLGRAPIDPAAAHVFVIRGDDLARCVVELTDSSHLLCAASGPTRITGLCADPPPADLLRMVDHPSVTCVGISKPADLRRPEGFVAAEHQANEAVISGRGIRAFEEGPVGSLAGIVDFATARDWAQAWLGALVSEESDLRETLHAWLARNGQVDAAAHDLGVHRHTVRHRLRRAETLLDRSLDDPSVRSDLWQALSVLDTSDV